MTSQVYNVLSVASQFVLPPTRGCVRGPPNMISFLKPVAVSTACLVHQQPLLVSLGRALADPDWPVRERHGDRLERFDPRMIHPQCDAGTCGPLTAAQELTAAGAFIIRLPSGLQ